MKTKDLYIQALGIHLPEGRTTLQEALESGRASADGFAGSDLVGVPVADGSTSAMDMTVAAARLALEEAKLDATEVDLVIHATMFRHGPEGWSPMGYVLRELGCRNVTGYDVNQGCNGVLAGIELAAGWLSLAPANATALVTTAIKADSPTVDRWRSPGFGIALGDGGSATLLGKGGGVARLDTICSSTFSELEGLHRGTLPLGEDDTLGAKVDIPTRAREFAISVKFTAVDFARVFKTMYAEVAQRALDEAGVGAQDLARVVFTNSGRDVLEADVMQPLGLPTSLGSWDYGRTIGHLGASDQVATLDHLVKTGQLVVGDRVLLVGGTHGYNVIAAVVTITDPGAATTPGS